MLPKVLKIRISQKDIWPENHSIPAKGITASLGTGATMLSKAIKIAMPAYPPVEIISVKRFIKGSSIFLYYFFSYRFLSFNPQAVPHNADAGKCHRASRNHWV